MKNFKVEKIDGKFQVVNDSENLDDFKVEEKTVKGTWQPVKELAVGKKTFSIPVTVFTPTIQEAIDAGFITSERVKKIREKAETEISSRIISNQFDMIRADYISNNYGKQKTLADLSPEKQLEMLQKLTSDIQDKLSESETE